MIGLTQSTAPSLTIATKLVENEALRHDVEKM
jgi:hypothetical protein